MLVPPGYDGPLPDGGFFIARSKTNRVLYAARSFLVKNDPKPAAENVKNNLKIYPHTLDFVIVKHHQSLAQLVTDHLVHQQGVATVQRIR